MSGRSGKILAAAVLFAPLMGSAALAQDAAAKVLSIELNKTTDAGAGCRLTFVARNETDTALDKASYEIAVFDANKQVSKLLIFEFGALPKGKTKVVEFEYPTLGCKDISRILVNTSPDCTVAGSASPLCLDSLRTTSLSNIAFDQ